MFRRILAAAAVVLVAAVLVVAVWPQLFGLERVAIIAQVVSLRGLGIAVALALVVVLVVVGALNRRIRRFTGVLTASLLIFCLVTFLVLSTRGYTGEERPTAGDSTLTVLSWNTLGAAPGVAGIADLVLTENADIVVLPETRKTTADDVVALLAQQGVEMRALTLSLDEISAARSTSLLVSVDLGEYRIDDSIESTPTVPSFVAVPVDGDGPAIVAAHPVAPIPGEFRAWQQGLDWLAARCSQPNVILAGDLNSTLDHYERLDIAPGASGEVVPGELAGCHDAARATGQAAFGTWPTQLPQILGAPIDHIMTTYGWNTVAFEVIGSVDDSGSDHRPVVATVRQSSDG